MRSVNAAASAAVRSDARCGRQLHAAAQGGHGAAIPLYLVGLLVVLRRALSSAASVAAYRLARVSQQTICVARARGLAFPCMDMAQALVMTAAEIGGRPPSAMGCTDGHAIGRRNCHSVWLQR